MLARTVVVGLLSCLAAALPAQEPICVIDGVVQPPGTCPIMSRATPPSRIEKVDVLKGEAARTLYGPGAERGVISITTNANTGDDPLARYLFPPELVMAHQQEIELTDAQRSAIIAAIKNAQGKFIDLQFRLSAEMEKLQRLLQGTTAEEGRVLDQLDHLLDAERQIKHAQLGLMIRVKNQLTERQQTTLSRIRQAQPMPVKPS